MTSRQRIVEASFVQPAMAHANADLDKNLQV
jgi:hypothetical protein